MDHVSQRALTPAAFGAAVESSEQARQEGYVPHVIAAYVRQCELGCHMLVDKGVDGR